MPKPTVNSTIREYRTPESQGMLDPKVASPNQGVDKDCAEYSFLKGALNPAWWSPDREALSRHTMENGASTFDAGEFRR